MKNKERKTLRYINPYLGGFLLGLTVLVSFYFTGRGLGASGAMKSVVVSAVDVVSHEHAENNAFYAKYVNKESHPMKSWLVFEVLGIFIGALISGTMAGRLGFKVEKGDRITSKTRLIAALSGGVLFGLGAQLGRGCTSGAALSGMSVLATSGFITMLAIFGSGYLFAYFFRKLWI